MAQTNDQLEAKIDAINRWCSDNFPQFAPPFPLPAPDPDPTPVPTTPVRADTAGAALAAIANGARHIQTSGFDVTSNFDGKGALIELIVGGPKYKPAIAIRGFCKLSNVTIKTPPSEFNATGQRTGFYKALEINKDCELDTVNFWADCGFCIHQFKSNVKAFNVTATTFSEYFWFQEADSFVDFAYGGYVGGSRSESGWRVSKARNRITNAVFDNSLGGKAAYRGDSPPFVDGSPGSIISRSRIVGQYGPNPLTEDDGGQMMGVDRWRFAEGYIFQPGLSKDVCIAFAQQQRAIGKTKREIVRACADKFIDPAKLATAAKKPDKIRLSENDIDLTLAHRAEEVGRTSYARIEESTIVGDVRLNARMKLEIFRCSIFGKQPFSGNSQQTYPFPINRVIDDAEIAPAPDVTIQDSEIRYSQNVGIDLTKWPSVKVTATPIAAQAVS